MFCEFIILMVLELTIRLVEEIEGNNSLGNNEEFRNIRGLIRMIQLRNITLMYEDILLIALNEINFRIG